VSYETLSYCWGELCFNTTITQDGSPKLITPSLFVALCELRKTDTVRTVWIDQLCIDQTNEIEKSTQVSVMQEIYRQSAHGIIWIGGLPTEKDDPGFTAEDVTIVFEMLEFFSSESYNDGDNSDSIVNHEGISERLGQALLAMMGSPYAQWKGVKWWQRIWTVQEAKLPPSSTLQWGHLTVAFDGLKRIALEMTQSSDYCYCFDQVFSLGWLLNQFCTPLANLQVQDVTGTVGSLYRWRNREATEPRDKVFALMGLLPDSPFPSIQFCDYSLPVAELYKLVTLDLIRENRGLLPLVGRRGEPRTTPGLPSWALDWMQPHDPALRTRDYYGNCRRWKFFNCAAGNYVDPIVTDSNGLALQGRKVDHITTLAPVQYVDFRAVTDDEYNDKAREIARNFRSVFETWLQTQRPNLEYVGGSSVSPLDAFRRTLIGDVTLVPSDDDRDHRASCEEVASVDAQIAGDETTMYHSLRDMVCSQSFFITQTGYIGIGPPDARIGDEVWVLLCGNYPHLLRPLNSNEQEDTGRERSGFEHIGDLYVHGIMDGEFIKRNEQAGTEKVIIY
jgi:hypothetical protein